MVPRRGAQPKLALLFANDRYNSHYTLEKHTISSDLSTPSFVGIRPKPFTSVGTNEGLKWVSSLR